MESQLILSSMYATLEKLSQQFLECLEGIPESDLNNWKPTAEQQGGGDMNTFAGLAVHTVAAARWRIEEQTFDVHYPRDRDSEFTATVTRDQIDQLFATMLNEFRSLIASGRDVDLAELPANTSTDYPDRNRFQWLLHAIDHTALHVGHAQIHRQLWLAERADSP